ncbi:MAG: zinc-ribbon domain-containing protein [Firmicutes bacterium]|nr:zinc-ribbon domain-containing protein [Bacillota bacterium]
MSEENKTIYCTECGSANSASSKFCSNCGTKLVQPVEQSQEQAAPAEGVFSSETAQPVYEKIADAEEIKPEQNFAYQEESNTSYGAEQSSVFRAEEPKYYSEPVKNEIQGGGNIGFAIASLVCGIISLLCCCLGLFSAVLAIAAVVLGIVTLCFKYDGKGMAIAGIITGGIALAILIFAIIFSKSVAYSEFLDAFSGAFY